MDALLHKAINYIYRAGQVLYTTDRQGRRRAFNIYSPAGNIITARQYCQSSGYHDTYVTYLSDIRGSITSIVNDTGHFIQGYRYTDFGITTRIGSGAFNEFAYTQGIWDSTTGLYYLNARFYNPVDGRFLTQDPYRGSNDQPDTWHLYGYCAGDPINWIDPSGNRRLPLSGRRIFLDPGHGGADPGATRRFGGMIWRESDLNLRLANSVRTNLINSGAIVRRSRISNITVSLNSRWRNANNWRANAFISIHHNSTTRRFIATNGASAIIPSNHNVRSSEDLARRILINTSSQSGLRNRGVFSNHRRNLAVLRGTNMPATLVEAGYMSNDRDMNIILNRRPQVARGISGGIQNYFTHGRGR